MLSIENSDPSCPCEISQLKSSDEKKASDKLALQEVDLFKSGLDDNNPLPKFSIRDYVFGARSKDIKANWPFSPKNLELCLKHGVTDLLPPFGPLDSVRNRSVGRCTVENCLVSEANTSNSDGEISRPIDEFVSVTCEGGGCNQKLTFDCVNTNSSGSESDREFPYSTTGGCDHLEVDSVPTNPATGGCDHLEVDSVPTNPSLCWALSETSAEETLEEAAVLPASHKNRSTIKKCRLIVKLSNFNNPTTNNKDITSNSFVSETMASQVCPVCKTFSSSSNTTLNAHIDQCLSGESTMKWTANSKVIKHRIKPRKMRSMMDIYVTAPYCTLEELDRRNGTSWATKSSLPVQDTQVCANDKERRMSTYNLEVTGHKGAVYIDANGKKVRILSKFNDVVSVSKVDDDPGPRKLLNGGKGGKFLSTKKKQKPHAQKHHKFLKLAPHSKNNCSSKRFRRFETHGGEERNFAVEESRENDEAQMQHFKAQKQIKLDDSETVGRWVCSKRTGFTKKTSGKGDHQHSQFHVAKDLLVDIDRSSFGLKTPNSSENPVCSPESSKRMNTTSSYEPQVDEYREQPPLRKMVGFPSLGSQVGGYGKRSPKRNSKQLTKEGTFVHDACKEPPNYTEIHASSLSNKSVDLIAGPTKNSDGVVISSKPSLSHHAFSSKARRFSSLRKHLLSVSRASVPESKLNLKRKCSALKKSQVRCISKLDEDAIGWPSQMKQQHDTMQDHRTKKRSRMEEISRKEEATALVSSPSAPQCYGHDVGENIDSSVRVGSALADTFDDEKSTGKEVQTHGEDIVIEPASRIGAGGSFMSLSKSLDPEFYKLASPPDAQCDSQHCFEVYQGSLCGVEGPICPTAPSLGDKKEMFCADDVGNVIIGQKTDMRVELDSKYGQGNYFSEVDPISIPGPPGSFLPSPGDMGSEDLQGNSSLTSSRLQSFEDHHDLVDGDSSDSPLSSTSAISNPILARSDSRSSEKKTVGPYAIQHEIRPSISGVRIESVVENFIPDPQAAYIGAERINVDDLKVNVIFPEKGTLSFKNDQPCCCSRKEGVSHQGVALNYQEPQLLRRCTMASLPLPAVIGKQMRSDVDKRPRALYLRSEMFSLSNFLTQGPEKVALPAMKSPARHTPMKVSANSEVKFPIHGDCDSASPSSSSNPILRLMGKNLVVVSKDEDVSPRLKQFQSNTMNEYPNPQLCTVSQASPGNIQNEDYHSFNQVVPQGPFIFRQNHNDTVAQYFDVRLSNNFRSHVDLRKPRTHVDSSGEMF